MSSNNLLLVLMLENWQCDFIVFLPLLHKADIEENALLIILATLICYATDTCASGAL